MNEEYPIHDHIADTIMDQAESAFYSGNYQKAIKLYEKVLSIEPNWERALVHSKQAEEYLQTGSIPVVALPSEVAIAYGKAQSASRSGRYKMALELLDLAKNTLEETGITKWKDGDELRRQIEANITAENEYEDGLKLLQTGELDQAVIKISGAYKATALPRYKVKEEEVHNLIKIIEEVKLLLSSKTYIDEGRLTEQARSLIDEFLRLPYEYSFIFKLKEQIRLLKANDVLYVDGYEAYEKRLERMLVDNPLNKDIMFRYEWVKAKKRVMSRQNQKRENYQRRVLDLRKWANIWSWISVFTALILLGIAVYIILTTVTKDNPLTALVSFLSFIPVLGSKLIYDQAKSISDEANQVSKQMLVEDESDLQNEQEETQELKKNIFGITSGEAKDENASQGGQEKTLEFQSKRFGATSRTVEDESGLQGKQEETQELKKNIFETTSEANEKIILPRKYPLQSWMDSYIQSLGFSNPSEIADLVWDCADLVRMPETFDKYGAKILRPLAHAFVHLWKDRESITSFSVFARRFGLSSLETICWIQTHGLDDTYRDALIKNFIELSNGENAVELTAELTEGFMSFKGNGIWMACVAGYDILHEHLPNTDPIPQNNLEDIQQTISNAKFLIENIWSDSFHYLDSTIKENISSNAKAIVRDFGNLQKAG